MISSELFPSKCTKASVSAGLGVKEENNLTLKLKLTLFFLGVKQDNVLTLTLKLTLIFPPRRGIWIIWDNPVLGTVILEGFSNWL
jgi:hypothetical protein